MICCSHLKFFPLPLDLPFFSCDLAKRPCPSQTPRVPRCMKPAVSICSCRFFDSGLQRAHPVSSCQQTNRSAPLGPRLRSPRSARHSASLIWLVVRCDLSAGAIAPQQLLTRSASMEGVLAAVVSTQEMAVDSQDHRAPLQKAPALLLLSLPF